MRLIEPAARFALVRITLGLLLAWEFATLAPFAARLFGDAGPVSTIHPLLPDSIVLVRGALAHGFLHAVLACVAMSFALGFARRSCAALLWLGWALVVNGIPTVAVPSDGFVGWLLLAALLIPEGEPRWPTAPAKSWSLPTPVVPTAWLALAAGYAVSGVGKLESPSWIDGSALALVLSGPVARDGFAAAALLELPAPLLRAATWAALALELGFPAMCLWVWTRAVAWVLMVLFHLAILLLLDVTTVSLAMLIFHALVLEEPWFSLVGSRSRFFSSEPRPSAAPPLAHPST